jgi:hypothetical protein
LHKVPYLEIAIIVVPLPFLCLFAIYIYILGLCVATHYYISDIELLLLVGARDDRTQSARAYPFFFPSLQTHPPKNLIPSSSFFQKIIVLTLGSLPEKGEKF